MYNKLLLFTAIAAASQFLSNAQDSFNTNASEVANRLSGSYQNTKQAKDPSYVLVKVDSCPIVVDNDGKYIYVEQTAVEYSDTPYRQRVYRLNTAGGDSVLSTIFKIENQESWTGTCNKNNARVPVVPAESLIDIQCAVKLDKFDNVYHGSTINGGCPTTFGGAVRATSTVTVYDNGFDAWDRGYDASENQVWGPVAGPYQFR
tara:strand:- start:693 stop:1301 length:609 start_codon:yes stop_codon:yes gene_type:complete